MNLSILFVFISGILSFFSPCILPLIPTFLTLITGISLSELQDRPGMGRIMFRLLAFCAGFSTVFILLGAAISSLGHLLLGGQRWFDLTAGLILLLFSLHLLGVFKLTALYRDFHFKFPRTVGSGLGAFLVGMVFSLGWTPCVGPILGAVLALAGDAATVGKGTLLLTVYSAGLAVPFILLGLSIGKAVQYVRFFARYTRLVEVMSALLIGAIGLRFLINFI